MIRCIDCGYGKENEYLSITKYEDIPTDWQVEDTFETTEGEVCAEVICAKCLSKRNELENHKSLPSTSTFDTSHIAKEMLKPQTDGEED